MPQKHSHAPNMTGGVNEICRLWAHIRQLHCIVAAENASKILASPNMTEKVNEFCRSTAHNGTFSAAFSATKMQL